MEIRFHVLTQDSRQIKHQGDVLKGCRCSLDFLDFSASRILNLRSAVGGTRAAKSYSDLCQQSHLCYPSGRLVANFEAPYLLNGQHLIMREILDIVQILRENHGILPCRVVIVQNTRKTRLCQNRRSQGDENDISENVKISRFRSCVSRRQIIFS